VVHRSYVAALDYFIGLPLFRTRRKQGSSLGHSTIATGKPWLSLLSAQILVMSFDFALDATSGHLR